MRSLLALTALAASSSAFVLPRQPLRALTPRAAMPTEIASAFDEVKKSAAMFPEGSADSKTASDIVSRLETASYGSWETDDLQLLDQCLIDDGAPACQAFMTAMTTLRELHDKSPGNA